MAIRNALLVATLTVLALASQSSLAGRVCTQYQTSQHSCSTCGGDGLEDSGNRIGRPKSEWKNKHTCRRCKGSGTVTRKTCIAWKETKPAKAVTK